MILKARADMIPYFRPYIEALVRDANSRGDTVNLDQYILKLMADQYSLLLCYDHEKDTVPLFVATYTVFQEGLRNQTTAAFLHFMTPRARDLAYRDNSKDREILKKYFAFADKVTMHITDQRLVPFLEQVGLKFTSKAIVLEVDFGG